MTLGKVRESVSLEHSRTVKFQLAQEALIRAQLRMSLLLLGYHTHTLASLPNPEQSNTELKRESPQSHLKTVSCERMRWTIAIEAGARERERTAGYQGQKWKNDKRGGSNWWRGRRQREACRRRVNNTRDV